MKAAVVNTRSNPPGSWRYRARRVFHQSLGGGGASKAALYASVLLGAGVAATYATAWAQCLVAPNQSRPMSTWSQGPLEVVRVDDGGCRPGEERIWWSDTYGWPFPSVGAVSSQVNSAASGEGRIRFRAGVRLGLARDLGQNGLTTPWALPVVPVSALFVVDVAIYFVLNGLVALAWAVRRDRRRLAAQLCIQCDYPLGTSDRCPECGHAQRA